MRPAAGDAPIAPDEALLRDALHRVWGFSEFRPLQREAMHAILSERIHLIFHQGDQGGDDERHAARHERRRLETERLASASRQDDDRIAAGQNGVHRVALQRTEGGVTPVAGEDVFEGDATIIA